LHFLEIKMSQLKYLNEEKWEDWCSFTKDWCSFSKINFMLTSAIEATNNTFYVHYMLLGRLMNGMIVQQNVTSCKQVQGVEIHFEMWPTIPVPGLVTDTTYKSWMADFMWTIDFTIDEDILMSLDTSIYQYTHVHTWLQIFHSFSKIFFCNTCQPTIFVNFVIQKLATAYTVWLITNPVGIKGRHKHCGTTDRYW